MHWTEMLHGKQGKMCEETERHHFAHLKVNRSALVTGRGVILQVSLKLHFACWEGLVLHGDSAVASKYCDWQISLPLMGLLVPVVHSHWIKGGDQSHLEVNGKTIKQLIGKTVKWLSDSQPVQRPDIIRVSEPCQNYSFKFKPSIQPCKQCWRLFRRFCFLCMFYTFCKAPWAWERRWINKTSSYLNIWPGCFAL